MAFANTQGGTVLIGVTDNRSVCGTTIGKEPLRHHIHIGRFKTPSMIIDDRQITDTLFEAVEQAMKVILFLISTWLYRVIKDNPGTRLPELSQKIHIPVKTLERWVKQLREDGKIIFKGAPKTGGYQVTDSGNTVINED